MLKTKFLLLFCFLCLVSYQNCAKPVASIEGLSSTDTDISDPSVEEQKISAAESVLLNPGITERLDPVTGANDAKKSYVDLQSDRQNVGQFLTTRLYGLFEGMYHRPMEFINLSEHRTLGFFVSKSSVSGSVLSVYLNGIELKKLDYPGSTVGSVVVDTMYWIRLPANAESVELRVTNDVGVVNIPSYVLSKLSLIDLQAQCRNSTSSLCALTKVQQVVLQ